MKFNKGKCQVHLLGENSLRQQEILGAILLRSSFAEKALELDTELTMRQQRVLAGKKAILDCIRLSVASSLGEVILSLCSAQVRSLPAVLCQVWAPHCVTHVDNSSKGLQW